MDALFCLIPVLIVLFLFLWNTSRNPRMYRITLHEDGKYRPEYKNILGAWLTVGNPEYDWGDRTMEEAKDRIEEDRKKPDKKKVVWRE